MKKSYLKTSDGERTKIFVPIDECAMTQFVKQKLTYMQRRLLYTLRQLEKKSYRKSIGFYALAGVVSVSICAVLSFCSQLPIPAVIGATVGTLLPGTAIGSAFSANAAKIKRMQESVLEDKRPADIELVEHSSWHPDVANAAAATKKYFNIKSKHFHESPFEEFNNTEDFIQDVEAYYIVENDKFDHFCKKLTEKEKTHSR